MKVIRRTLPDFPLLRILVLADLHLGDCLVNMEQANSLISEVRDNDNTYLIVNGDLINNATKTSISDIYGEVMTPNQALNLLGEMLEPIKHKILVMTEGNHELRTYRQDGIFLLERVSRELGIKDVYSVEPYLLYLENEGKEVPKQVFSIYGKHGTGGGKKIGAKMNKLEDMLSIVDADIFIHSHTHVPASFRLSSIRTNDDRRSTYRKEHLFVNSSAFLDYGGYGEAEGYRPTSIMYPEILVYADGRRRAII